MRHIARDFQSAQSEQKSVQSFIDEEFAEFAPEIRWAKSSRTVDNEHAHWTFDLTMAGRRVVGRQLKVHFNRKGFVEYASSNWNSPVSVAVVQGDVSGVDRARERIIEDFESKFFVRPGRLDLSPVIWMSPDGDRAVPAVEALLVHTPRGVVRKFIVDEHTGEILEEERAIRFANNIYPVSPYNGGANNGATSSVEPTGLQSGATTLANTYLHVYRDQLVGAVPTLSDVTPATAYVPNVLPSAYNHTCTGATNQCPQQAFDAFNVYYHLETFRERIRDYLTGLGVSSSLPADPLTVIVNSLGLDFDGDGDGTDEANNAAYVAVPCRDNDPTITKCLVFLRPAAASSSTCGDNKTFYSTAREALIIVHEFQHYVTDSLTGLQMGSGQTNVGDALHEGYSDYFAASHVSQMVGADVTIVGEYAFQNCDGDADGINDVVRTLGSIKEYDKDNTDPGPHVYGWSWASGLWALRKEISAEQMDRVALKSLLLMSPTPGFVDAVEALVQADKALYGGAHVARIREVFYNDVKFIGGSSDQFRDVAAGVVEVGLRSCLSVASAGGPATASLTWGLWAAWVSIAVALGRFVRRSR